MPRSANTWPSRRMLEYVDDKLALGRPFALDDVATYFSCDRSLASMTMSAYRQQGGDLPERSLGFLEGDEVHKGALRNGAKAWFVPPPNFRSLLNSTPARITAWDAIRGDACSSLNEWFSDRILDYIDDGHKALEDYFDISKATANRYQEAYNALPGKDGMKRRSTLERRKAWEVWD